MDADFYVKILTEISMKLGALVEKIGSYTLIMILNIKAS